MEYPKVDHGDVLQELRNNLSKANEDLANATPGSDEYEASSKVVERLTKLILEDEKANFEQDIAYFKLEMEQAKAAQEARDKKIDRWVNISIKGVEIIVPLAVYCALYDKGLRFEVTNTVTSSWFRNLMNKLPWKK